MTALFGGYGPTWTPRAVEVPEPGPGQIVVRAGAVALNNADAAMLDAADPGSGTGEPYRAGFEFAGEVCAVGPRVSTFKLGDRVMGTTPEAFAEYVVADYRHAVRIPDGVEFGHAAALPTASLTEHGALRVGGFRPGNSVLITAATSGVGLVGVQIARELGASRVIATTRAITKSALLAELGADIVIDTSTGDLTKEVLSATDGVGADVVLDHVGGATFGACLPATAVDGCVVDVGRLDTAVSTIDLDTVASRHLTVRGVSFGFTRANELGDALAGAAAEVVHAVGTGRIRPVIDSRYRFDDADRAVERLRSGSVVGKIVLVLD